MPRRPGRKHSSAFKAKVAPEAVKGEQPLIEIAERFDVHPTVITKWKRQLLEGAPEVFGAGETDKGQAADVERLHAKIGARTLRGAAGLQAPTRARSSPARASPACSPATTFRSAWMAAAAGWTTSSSSASGEA